MIIHCQFANTIWNYFLQLFGTHSVNAWINYISIRGVGFVGPSSEESIFYGAAASWLFFGRYSLKVIDGSYR